MTTVRVLSVLVMCMVAASAQPQVAGQDYELLTPAQRPGTAGKIEVVEFFSYGCPHCYAMEPLISKWAAQLPASAVLIRVPVALGHREWGQLSRAYYALQSTGDLARLDDALFAAIHKEKLPLFDEDSITAWVAGHAVDAARFRTAFNSQPVSTRVFQAEQMSRSYKVGAVPHLSVDGKYTVLGKTYQEILANARRLIDKSAAEKQAANR